jgi:4-hydroxy-tetrahydrodipicolinate synthase
MTAAYRPSGLLVPVITPFADDGAVDLAALERLAGVLLDAGATGLVALSTTAEPSSLTAAERDATVAALAAVCRDRGADLVVGAGTNDTRTTIERHVALADVPGVVASLAVVPYYVRPTEAAIVAHFQAVAAASPVPLITYNIPYRTGRGLGAPALLELASTDNVAGLKQAVGALDADTLAVLAGTPEGFAVLGGDDAFLLPTVLMGGAGAIAAASHLATERFVAMLGRRRRRAGRRGPGACRGAAAPGRRRVRRAEPGGRQGGAARRGADRHAGRADAAVGRAARGAGACAGRAGRHAPRRLTAPALRTLLGDPPM